MGNFNMNLAEKCDYLLVENIHNISAEKIYDLAYSLWENAMKKEMPDNFYFIAIPMTFKFTNHN